MLGTKIFWVQYLKKRQIAINRVEMTMKWSFSTLAWVQKCPCLNLDFLMLNLNRFCLFVDSALEYFFVEKFTKILEQGLGKKTKMKMKNDR